MGDYEKVIAQAKCRGAGMLPIGAGETLCRARCRDGQALWPYMMYAAFHPIDHSNG